MLVILDLASKALAICLEFFLQYQNPGSRDLSSAVVRKLLVEGGWGGSAGAQHLRVHWLALCLLPCPHLLGLRAECPQHTHTEVGPGAVQSLAEESQSWHWLTV